MRLRLPLQSLVLAYHGIGALERRLDPHDLMVTPDRFVYQIEALRRRGVQFNTLNSFAAALREGMLAPGTCAVTFDDATVDNIEHLPALIGRLHLPVTVFVCSDLLGRPHFAMPSSAQVRMLTADEVRVLARHPLVDIGSHTMRHTDLSTVSFEEAYREMRSSKESLEDLIGQPVNAFAYPYCHYSEACPSAARRSGYEVAVTCGGRGSHDAWELRRESIGSRDSRLTFALKSRLLYYPLYNSRAGRTARWSLRSIRHPQAIQRLRSHYHSPN